MPHVNIYCCRRALQKYFFGKHCNDVDIPLCIILELKKIYISAVGYRRKTHGVVGQMRIFAALN